MRTQIGIFDSGIGGFSVLAACVRRFPALRYLYLGDNLRAPYGSRPKEEIAAFTEEALRRFERLGVSAAVVACNTATAVCLGEMRKLFSFPILGTEPAVLPAAAFCKDVLVLCTPRTAESGRLRILLSRCPGTKFTVCACPGLAAAIEREMGEGTPFSLGDHLPSGTFGGVVLGCTHYALIAERIAAFYGAPVYDGADGIARRLGSILGLRVDTEWRRNGHTNKSLPQFGGGREAPGVVFLGKCAKMNRKIFEQTFILTDRRDP